MMKDNYIKDVSTSETKLKRFTRVCLILQSEKGKSEKGIYKAIKNELKLTNDNVIKRHLSILKKWNMLRYDKFKLTSYGKSLVLYLLKNNLSNKKVITNFEKIFYLKQMLSNEAFREQLLLILESINGSSNDFDSIYHFFSRDKIRNIWDYSKIEKNLKRMEESETKDRKATPRAFSNWFYAVKSWLTSLNILEIKNVVKLTRKGIGVLKSLKSNENLFDIVRSYSDSGKYLSDERLIIKLAEYIDKYGAKTKIIDFLPIKNIFFIGMLNSGIFLEEKEIYNLLRLFATKNKISLVVGRRGQPSKLIL